MIFTVWTVEQVWGGVWRQQTEAWWWMCVFISFLLVVFACVLYLVEQNTAFLISNDPHSMSILSGFVSREPGQCRRLNMPPWWQRAESGPSSWTTVGHMWNWCCDWSGIRPMPVLSFLYFFRFVGSCGQLEEAGLMLQIAAQWLVVGAVIHWPITVETEGVNVRTRLCAEG